MSITYSWSDKTKVVQHYMLNGNLKLASEVFNISYDTLSSWKKSEWWGQLVEELRASAKAKRGTKLSSIIDTSLELIQDRLENGDWIYDNKTGKPVRRPVSLRDVTQVTNNLIEKQLKMEEMADRLDTNKNTVQETLAILAKEFQKLNRNKQNKEAIDVNFKELDNAVHEEREEGLQTGSSSLHLETRSEKEES